MLLPSYLSCFYLLIYCAFTFLIIVFLNYSLQKARSEKHMCIKTFGTIHAYMLQLWTLFDAISTTRKRENITRLGSSRSHNLFADKTKSYSVHLKHSFQAHRSFQLQCPGVIYPLKYSLRQLVNRVT